MCELAQIDVIKLMIGAKKRGHFHHVHRDGLEVQKSQMHLFNLIFPLFSLTAEFYHQLV